MVCVWWGGGLQIRGLITRFNRRIVLLFFRYYLRLVIEYSNFNFLTSNGFLSEAKATYVGLIFRIRFHWNISSSSAFDFLFAQIYFQSDKSDQLLLGPPYRIEWASITTTSPQLKSAFLLTPCPPLNSHSQCARVVVICLMVQWSLCGADCQVLAANSMIIRFALLI